MKRLLLSAVALAALAVPATARDTSFTFKGDYRGKSFAVDKLSDDECSKLLVNPLVMIPTDDGSRLAVPATDVTGRQCVASEITEVPDEVMHFVGFDQPVKFFRSTDPAQSDHIQVGDGPKVEVSVGAKMWTWEDNKASYYLVDDLTVTDKATGKETTYRKPEPPDFFDTDAMIKLMNKHKKHHQ